MASRAESVSPVGVGVGPWVPAGWRLTALLIFTQLPGVIAYTIPLPLLAGMASDLARDPDSAWLAKMVLGILGPAMAVGALLGGWLADRMDRRWLLMGLGSVYLAAALAPAVMASLEAIVATRFVVGATAGSLAAIGFTMVGDYLPENRRAATIGMLSAINMVASLATLPVAGFIGESGWRLPFLLYVLALPLVLLASPSSLPVPVRPAVPAGHAATVRRWYSGIPPGLCLLGLCVGIILTVPGIYVSFHLASVGLGKTSTVGLLMMLNSGIAAVLSALFGRIWRWSPRAVFCASFAAMGGGLLMFAYATGAVAAGIALLAMGTGMGLLAPSVIARVVDTVSEGQRGKVIGVVQGIMAAAPLLGLALLEPLIPAIGTRGVMIAIALLSGALLLVFALSRGEARSKS